MINSILIPVIIAQYIAKNLYFTSGLVDNIFMMSFTNSLVTPLLAFFDPGYYIGKIKRCINSRPSNFYIMKIISWPKIKKITMHYIWDLNLRLELSIFMWSICLCFRAILYLCSRFVCLWLYLVIYWCIGSKNIACSIDTGDQFQVATL